MKNKRGSGEVSGKERPGLVFQSLGNGEDTFFKAHFPDNAEHDFPGEGSFHSLPQQLRQNIVIGSVYFRKKP